MIYIKNATIVHNWTKNDVVKQVSLKRKVEYPEGEVAEAQEHVSKMRLD